ncbi:hypothetical protein BV25DRAFT_1825414 [Artomyces pyxidatus]|uniref:Uncharacterized protein n=1 Tax=Artomyces pyxidatus TaxID=48021 RepID=A0ACB8T218_9AGAM|nr:hypothetical protein BV25DRAFT_1825414 [Artomyces pyxidatus]
MLNVARKTAVQVPPWTRANSQAVFIKHKRASLAFPVASTSATDKADDGTVKDENLLLRQAHLDTVQRTAFVRPWRNIGSLTEAFVYVRALERHYGKIRDFRFLRDPDLMDRYQPFFWVVFESAESRNRIPKGSETIQVLVPTDPPREGGPGLDDLQGVMQSVDYNPAATDPTRDTIPEGWALVDVLVDHASGTIGRQNYGTRYKAAAQIHRARFSDAWTRWGGFSSVLPHEALPPQPSLFAANAKWAAIAEETKGERANTEEEDAEAPQPVEADADEWRDNGRIEGSESFPAPPTEWEPLATPPPPVPPEPLAAAEPEPPEKKTPAPAPVKKLSRRERILQAARENARTPLPKIKTSEEREAVRQTVEEVQAAKQQSISQRLWKFVGGQ